MSSNVAIKVEGLGKLYRLGEVGTGTLSQDLSRTWARLRGKEDPFAIIGETNDRTTKGQSDFVWSLKDVDFEVKKGEVLGIIGRNGAGKSTLLKILSKVTAPTTGNIKVRGRIASLLEVGTGFHPELTGRENIFLNGAILGMTKAEIRSKFDEIVDFSGVERYIDTPVKRYSSGMYVRLAFAVAAFLEPEILIVDEVLAVGDAEFQKKCLGRMKDVSDKDGRTVLFVSHNLQAVSSLCTHGVYLQYGQVKSDGEINKVIQDYSGDKGVKYSKQVKIVSEGKRAWLVDVKCNSIDDNDFKSGASSLIEIDVMSLEEINNVNIGIGFNNSNDYRVFTLYSKFKSKSYNLVKGVNKIYCETSSLPLFPGLYNLEVFIGSDYETLDYYDKGLQIEVEHNFNISYMHVDSTHGDVLVEQNWK
ncbi:polysaccharide ABC transporter ATP-binding protein [Hymenobacter sp. BT559]|uniref:ABC transporter ATP-binding protein n=1 Tax=Hymenobacter sp. BT559 TaxID=2795729 RepID=UPI0018EA4385|nr:polysaccharide ABC transporter ATP-binding protein [Hymenobacter sp. BT559]MBJ6141840.1 ATP-binding cassette domain-containing protein [Hymenobacter sp. BT559]